MSLKDLINEHFSEQPINNVPPTANIGKIVKENIVCDVKDICCDIIKSNMVDKVPIERTTKDYNVSTLLNIKLLIPYSEYNQEGFYYVMKCDEVKEIPINKAMRLIEQGFAIKA
ncbi:MAG: hypothetical protein KAJ39_04995 [Gammaproteobacteria bacterium]|nr:hypothetical protein [Gammaproteobacteria bacterium]